MVYEGGDMILFLVITFIYIAGMIIFNMAQAGVGAFDDESQTVANVMGVLWPIVVPLIIFNGGYPRLKEGFMKMVKE